MTSIGFQKNIEDTAQLIFNSHHIVAITGAGISTPSGIPDFRSSKSGLWTKNDPMKVASLSAYNKNPEIVFDWLRPLIVGIQNSKPNFAHYALSNLEKQGFLKSIITQNIDNFHQKAGSKYVIEIHGSLNTFHCPVCKFIISSEDEAIINKYIIEESIPTCPNCGSILKPDITLYEEQLPFQAWEQAHNECLKADLILVIGTSLEVTPVNYLPRLAFSNGAKIIINTYSQTYLDPDAAIILREDVCVVWPAVVKEIEKYGEYSS